MKKGQIEVIGLAVIVILIIVGGLFFVRLYIMKPSSQSKDIESTTVNNLLSALLKTTICENNDVFEGIKSCYEKTLVCNQEACKFTQDKVKEILNLTLTQYDYKLEIKADNEIISGFSLGSCKTGIAAAPYSIPSKGVSYDISFKICKK